MHKIINKSSFDLNPHKKMMDDFLLHIQKILRYDRGVKIILISDTTNEKRPLGKTGFYAPDSDTIGVYVDGRHIKDILRSLAHELVHHTQNCRGEFGGEQHLDAGPGYAQKNPHLRKMEKQAYLNGNLFFRDWEDIYKRKKIKINVIVKEH